MAALAPEAPLTIPVVVHVVYNEQSENTSKAQIESQTTVLNQDYAAQNADKANVHGVRQGLATDTNIRFALASEDPAGNSTTGITRTTTDRAAFGIDAAVKSAATGGADPWPTDRYLNMWACTLEGGLLGYAQFPGGPPQTGGVVIRNTAFGTTGAAAAPFNLGRTATHEVGHFFNLYHVWGTTDDCSGGDMVSDTPNAERPSYGEQNVPRMSCNNAPERRHVHELHELRRRQSNVHVHRPAGGADDGHLGRPARSFWPIVERAPERINERARHREYSAAALGAFARRRHGQGDCIPAGGLRIPALPRSEVVRVEAGRRPGRGHE
jgi:Pregnancy-associated plasma protein-A